MPEALDKWFAAEILVHEQVLVGYLLRVWPHRDEVDDLRQEIYVRVYEAAAKALPAQPRAFLFATARNLIVDRVRRSRVVSIEAVGGLGELEGLNVLLDEPSVERHASARQELRRLAAAFDRLPTRCREVLWLRRVEDLPQKDVAQRMGIGERAVEKGLARAMSLLTAALFGGDANETKESNQNDEMTHGKRQGD